MLSYIYMPHWIMLILQIRYQRLKAYLSKTPYPESWYHSIKRLCFVIKHICRPISYTTVLWVYIVYIWINRLDGHQTILKERPYRIIWLNIVVNRSALHIVIYILLAKSVIPILIGHDVRANEVVLFCCCWWNPDGICLGLTKKSASSFYYYNCV